MFNPEIHRFLSISLVLLISSNGIVWGTQVFAANHCDKNDDKKCNHSVNHCDKNDDKKCNHSEKNQKSTSKGPVITINPTSGPSASLVTVTGNGFDPSSPVVISFQGSTVAWTSSGAFNTTFNVPSTSSNGDHIVKAIQGSNSASKTFKVTDMVNPKATQGTNSSSKTFTDTNSSSKTFTDTNSSSKTFTDTNSSSETFTNTSSVTPTITFNSTSEPIGTSVNITGAGFIPSSTVVITFNDTDITTTPTIVTTSNNGEFFANFTVPLSSSVGFVQVVATQGSNSASETFIVTSSPVTKSQLNATATAPSSPNMSEKMIPPNIFGGEAHTL